MLRGGTALLALLVGDQQKGGRGKGKGDKSVGNKGKVPVVEEVHDTDDESAKGK